MAAGKSIYLSMIKKMLPFIARTAIKDLKRRKVLFVQQTKRRLPLKKNNLFLIAFLFIGCTSTHKIQTQDVYETVSDKLICSLEGKTFTVLYPNGHVPDNLKKEIDSNIQYYLVRKNIKLTERQRLEPLFSEFLLSERGFVSEDSLKRAGEFYGIDYFIDISVYPDKDRYCVTFCVTDSLTAQKINIERLYINGNISDCTYNYKKAEKYREAGTALSLSLFSAIIAGVILFM